MRLFSPHLRNITYVIKSSRLNCSLMKSHVFFELLVRLVLLIIFCYLETLEPFQRVIPHEQLWHYKYPHHESTISTPLLFVIVISLPIAFILVHYIFNKDFTDLIQGVLGLLLACLLNGIIVNLIKISVGRPRPDFFYRCFVGGHMTPDLQCNGDPQYITEGRKSFPSGHSSWMFAGFGYLSLYLTGKLQCFTSEGRSQSWRLIAVFTPLVLATLVGISRIQDYRHHWEDVVVGGAIGLVIGYFCYRHHYPSPFQESSMFPYPLHVSSLELPHSVNNSSSLMMSINNNRSSSKAQLNEEKTL